MREGTAFHVLLPVIEWVMEPDLKSSEPIPRGTERILDMCKSQYVFKKLRKFRAGFESGISWLKRSFELTRCLWKGFDSFKSYVWSSIVSANLLTIARKQMS